MQTQMLKIMGEKTPQAMQGATHALKNLSGVAEVIDSPSEGLVTVRFNQERTSIHELRATLLNAGYNSQALDAPASNEGSCCGGCGG